jgi:hypothetical protein
MTYFAELSQYAYDGTVPKPSVLNIGWLSGNHSIPTETPSADFCRRFRTARGYTGKSL